MRLHILADFIPKPAGGCDEKDIEMKYNQGKMSLRV